MNNKIFNIIMENLMNLTNQYLFSILLVLKFISVAIYFSFYFLVESGSYSFNTMLLFNTITLCLAVLAFLSKSYKWTEMLVIIFTQSASYYVFFWAFYMGVSITNEHAGIIEALKISFTVTFSDNLSNWIIVVDLLINLFWIIFLIKIYSNNKKLKYSDTAS